MSINALTFALDDAAALLDSGNNDAAIDALRAADTPNDAQSCGLLARAYFQRGDTKGDIYASHYFARRARQLGCDEPTVAAIQAVGALRKEQFEEAIQVFDSFITADSPPATKLLYGVALDQCANPWDARVWIESALEGLPEDDTLFTLAWHVQWKGLVRGDQNEQGPAVQNMYATVIETLKASQAKDIEAPFKHNAVSKLRGHGTAAKDFNWVKKNIPCQAACPASTDIPGYLSAIYHGDYDTAYRKNLLDNAFPAVLGSVCARPCEKVCRHGWEGLGEPVAICWSKRSAADFKSRPPVVLDRLYEPTGKRVAVIGAGVAGLAAARNLALLGHTVTVYEKHNKPGGTLNQGIPMEFFARPMAYLGDVNGRVKAMRFIRTRPGQVDAGGRRRPVDIPGSEFELPCDTVLLATGQFPDTAWIDETFRDLLVGEDDWLKSVSSSLTDHARIFATGDFATGAKSLIDAIGHAKACVQRVDRFLMGEARLFDVVEVSDAPGGSGRIREMDAVPLQHIPTIPVAARALTSEVETGYARDTSVDEAQRCYLCHYKYEIDIDKCIYCEWCIKAKPRPDCIVRVKDLRYDEQGVIVGFNRAQSTEETKMIYIN